MCLPCCWSISSNWICLHACACYLARSQPQPLPSPVLFFSPKRFTAKQPWERVHTLCPVSVLHPDNYCYIYHSKWEPWTGVITGWSRSKEGEGGKRKSEARKSGRKTEQWRAVRFEVTKVCFKLSCAFFINHSACDKLCFSLNHFQNWEVGEFRLKGMRSVQQTSRIFYVFSACVFMCEKNDDYDLCLHVSH